MWTSRRVSALSEFSEALQGAADFTEAGKAAVGAVAELLECEIPIVSLAPEAWMGPAVILSNRDSEARLWQSVDPARFVHRDACPIYTHRLRKFDGEAHHTDELVPRADFERGAFFNEVYRPIGARHSLQTLQPGRYSLTLCATRTTDTPFEAWHGEALTLMARQLDATVHRLVREGGGRLRDGEREYDMRTFDWLVVDDEGNVLRSDKSADQMLAACTDAEAGGQGESAHLRTHARTNGHADLARTGRRIPAAWLADLRARARGGPPKPRRYSVDGKPVSVFAAPIRGAGSREHSIGFLTLQSPPRHTDPLRPLQALGLTAREAEVLQWLAEGKTNPEIGIILGITTLTAKKHVENLMHKLGVETRTAAAVRALEARDRV